MSLFLTIILDGVGIGAAPDAARYGDAGSNTLGHVCAEASPRLPNLGRLGLGCIDRLEGVPCVASPEADFGKMQERSAGKDSTTGHWELAGLEIDRPFPTYPDGFPPELIEQFLSLTGAGGILGNEAASGTEIISRLGEEHQETGWPIVYTSADSVFQVATHTDTIPLDGLYDLCETARTYVCTGPHAVGRVIARPFSGRPGAYARISEARKDFSLKPPRSLLDELREGAVRTVSVGKVGDLFAHEGFDLEIKTRSNREGVEEMLRAVKEATVRGRPTFVWANLVDFDQEFGHRNDVEGFAKALMEFDSYVPRILDAVPPGGRVVITADHGNDPAFPGTDHTREYVPVLSYPGSGRALGTRSSFRDHAASVADFFGCASDAGKSFL